MKTIQNQLDINSRTLGVTFSPDHQAKVVLWAPLAKQVALTVNDHATNFPLTSDHSGYWHLETDQLKPGDTYTFVLDDEKVYADPASLFQPQGVYGPSQAVDTNKFYWEDSCWVNPPLDDYTVYELDVRKFSPKGTYDAVVRQVGQLKKRGINALLIKSDSSIAASPNELFLYATPASYGGPYQLHHLVNACHYEGIAVILDINYTEISKQNAYLKFHQSNRQKASQRESTFATDSHRGAGRRYVIDSALMWFRDFHIDALRLNAVYTLPDSEQILKEIRAYTDQLTDQTGTHYYLLVEHELANKPFIGNTATQNTPQDSEPLPVSTNENPGSYYPDNQLTKIPINTYREDCMYDEYFSSVLRELFGRQAQPGNSGEILRSF
ncbi:alpha-amylase family protein [Spirosoma jeollabukense]